MDHNPAVSMPLPASLVPRRGGWRPVLAGSLAAVLVAMAGGLLTEIGPWHLGLRKPFWQPPDWLFGPAWTLIFTLTVVAGVKAWNRAPDAAAQRLVILLFGVNGVLNVLWSALFFHLRRPDWALVEVVPLWLSILAPMVVLGRWSPASRWLLLPYLAWVSFAAVLNLAIFRLNAPF